VVNFIRRTAFIINACNSIKSKPKAAWVSLEEYNISLLI